MWASGISATSWSSSRISSAVNATSGSASGAARFIMVIQKIRQLRMASTETRFTRRLAVRSLEVSALQPDFNILWKTCRVRDWRGIFVKRDPFPAPPHKNCS